MPQAARTHKSHSRAPRKARRGTASQRGYDHQWAKVRAIHIASHPYCEDCKDEGKLNMTNLEVDHIIPIGVRPDLRLSLDNLRTRCRRHHKLKTDEDKRRFVDRERNVD